MWARFHQLVYEMKCGQGFARQKVLPVLVTEADKHGRGFAILFMKYASQIWARFRQLVYEMSFTNVGKFLPV